MKITQTLYRQHLGRMIKFNWFAATRKRIGLTHAEASLTKMGIPVADPLDVVIKKEILDVSQYFNGYAVEKEPQKNENHPMYKVRPCLRVRDHDLLVQGIAQAQNLTKTVIIKEALPESIEKLIEDTSSVDSSIERIIRTSNIFDAQQVKLPKKKDPERPAWNFPREYGISDVRKSLNLTVKMVQLCESLCGLEIAKQRQIVQKSLVQLPIFKDSELLKLSINIDFLMTSKTPLNPIATAEEAQGKTLPDLFPLGPTAGLVKDHFYDLKIKYPIAPDSPWLNAHTLFVYHNVEKVKNHTELPIKSDQLIARSLIESFATAATCARLKYGDDVTELPTPITIQCVQVDGQNYDFSVFQLNTLDLDTENGKMNFWWTLPRMQLFQKATYENGRPVFEGYNPEVFKRILAFYKNA